MWETSGRTSANSCGPRQPEWETCVGDKWETSGRQVQVGNKWETSAKSCGPRHPEWETSVGDKCGRQVWETSVGDKCKIMRPKTPRGPKSSVGDKWKTSVNSCGPRQPSVRDKWETSVKSCGPRHPEWETSVEDKCRRQV